MAAEAIAGERQESGVGAFLRACATTAWLEYRNLRYYPSNLLLAAVQELTMVALWYFTARFLSAGANRTVHQYGGDYLAYVLVGVLVNQVGLAALGSPFTTISEAFWDKRLETYRLSIHGIWANVVGRLGWQVLFSLFMQGGAFVILLLIGALSVHVGPQLILALVAAVLFVAANAGIGSAGASLFFLLEVKSGADPITWTYKYLVMLITGLYIPLSVLPGWVQQVGKLLPQTEAFSVVRAVLLTGAGPDSRLVVTSLFDLALITAIAVVCGCLMLRTALRRAEQRGGIGVVV
jgi:ABC-2 type transport system permease protein